MKFAKRYILVHEICTSHNRKEHKIMNAPNILKMTFPKLSVHLRALATAAGMVICIGISTTVSAQTVDPNLCKRTVISVAKDVTAQLDGGRDSFLPGSFLSEWIEDETLFQCPPGTVIKGDYIVQ